MSSFSARPSVGFVDALLHALSDLSVSSRLVTYAHTSPTRFVTSRHGAQRLNPSPDHDGHDSICTRTDILRTITPRDHSGRDFMGTKTDGLTMNPPRDHDCHDFYECEDGQTHDESVT